jgi:hypothetical protein
VAYYTADACRCHQDGINEHVHLLVSVNCQATILAPAVENSTFYIRAPDDSWKTARRSGKNMYEAMQILSKLKDVWRDGDFTAHIDVTDTPEANTIIIRLPLTELFRLCSMNVMFNERYLFIYVHRTLCSMNVN